MISLFVPDQCRTSGIIAGKTALYHVALWGPELPTFCFSPISGMKDPCLADGDARVSSFIYKETQKVHT